MGGRHRNSCCIQMFQRWCAGKEWGYRRTLGAWERVGDSFSGGGTPQKSPGWARGLRPHHRCVPLMTASCGTGQKPQRCPSMDQILGCREARQLPRASSRVTVWRSDFHEGAWQCVAGGCLHPSCCPLELHGSLSLSHSLSPQPLEVAACRPALGTSTTVPA